MSAPAGRQQRVLVVDDHPIVRLGIRQMLSSQKDLEICGETASAAEALELARALRPDLVLVDLALLQGTGMDLIRRMKEVVPGLQVLVVSMHDEMLFAERTLRAGARGYIMKDAAIDGLIGAIRQVLGGEIHVSPRVAQAILERTSRGEIGPDGGLETLTDRELAVFDLVGRGRNTAEIAEQLAVSVKTIETYRANIRGKLKLKDANDLVRFAATWAAKF